MYDEHCNNCLIGVYFHITNLVEDENHINKYINKIKNNDKYWKDYLISIFQYYFGLDSKEIIFCGDCEWTKSFDRNRKNTKRNSELVCYMELFDVITMDDLIEKTRFFINNNDYYKEILINMYNKCKEILTKEIKFWDDLDLYFEYIFEIPKILHDAGVTKEIYQYRKDIFFDDVICGHPKASDGWLKEAMDNLRDLGAF